MSNTDFSWALPPAPGQYGAKSQPATNRQPTSGGLDVPFGFKRGGPVGGAPFSPYQPTWQNAALRDRPARDWGTPDWVNQGMDGYPGVPSGMFVPTEGDVPGMVQNVTMGLGRFAPPGIAMPMIQGGKAYAAAQQNYYRGMKLRADMDRQQAMMAMAMAKDRLQTMLFQYSNAYAEYGPSDPLTGGKADPGEPDRLKERLYRIASDNHDQNMLNLLAQDDLPAIDKLLKHLDGQGQELDKATKLLKYQDELDKRRAAEEGTTLDNIGRSPLQVPNPKTQRPSSAVDPVAGAGNNPQPAASDDPDNPTLPPIAEPSQMKGLRDHSMGDAPPADDTSQPQAAPAAAPIAPPPAGQTTQARPGLAGAAADMADAPVPWGGARGPLAQATAAAPAATFADRFGAVQPTGPQAPQQPAPVQQAPPPAQRPAPAPVPPTPIAFDPLKRPGPTDAVYPKPMGGQWGPVDPPPAIPNRNGPGDIGLTSQQIRDYANIMLNTGQLPPQLRGGSGATSKLLHTQAMVVSAYASQMDKYMNDVLRHVVPGDDQSETLRRINAVDPDMAVRVRAILKGHLQLPVTGYGANSRFWARVSNFVFGVDPNFNNSTFTVATRTRAAFDTGGYIARQNGGMVRAYEHGALIYELARAAKEGNNQVVNATMNRIRTVFGDPNITNLQQAFNMYANELVNTFRGGVGAEADINRILHTAGPHMTPDQMIGFLGTTARLMHAQGDTFALLWNRGTHNDNPDVMAPNEYLRPGTKRPPHGGAVAEDFLAIGDGSEAALKAERFLMSIPVGNEAYVPTPHDLMVGGGGRQPVQLDAPGTSPQVVQAQNFVILNKNSTNPEIQRQVKSVQDTLRKMGIEGY